MALPESEIEVLALYSTESRNKLERYIHEGRVLLTEESRKGFFSARVIGNHPQPYTVFIELSGKDLPSASGCSCLATSLCVHIGAAWVSHLRSRAGTLDAAGFSQLLKQRMEMTVGAKEKTATPGSEAGRTSDTTPAENPLVLPSPQIQTLPTILPTNSTSDPDGDFRGIFSHDAPAPTQKTKKTASAETWVPGFELQDRLVPRKTVGEASVMNHVLTVAVVLRFMRQDGSTGRSRKWDPAWFAENVAYARGFWIDLLLAQGGAVELDRLLLLSRQPGALPLPVIHDAKGNVLVLEKADNLSLLFSPRAEAWGAREFNWQAQLHVVADAPISVHWECGLGQLLLIAGPAHIFMFEADSRLLRLLDLLADRRLVVSEAEIRQIEQGQRDNPIPGLSISVPPPVRGRQLARGLPVLTLETGVAGVFGSTPRTTMIHLDIQWEFTTFEGFSGPLDENWLRHVSPTSPTDQTPLLWIRDLDWESSVCSFLEKTLQRIAGDAFQIIHDDDDEIMHTLGTFRAVPAPGPRSQLRELERRRDYTVHLTVDQFLRQHGAVLMDEGFSLRLKRDGVPSVKSRVGITVDRGMDWLEIEAFIEGFAGNGKPGSRRRAAVKNMKTSAARREELSEIQDLLQYRIVRTSDRFIVLDAKDAEFLQNLLDSGALLDEKIRIATTNTSRLAQLHGPASSNIREIAAAHELVGKLSSIDTLEMLDPEPGFTATLRGYQKRGYSWLMHMQDAGLGACLADDMGLGKTVQSLAFLHALHKKIVQNGKPFHALLVVPVSTLSNWENETSSFAPELRTLRHHGPERPRETREQFLATIASAELVLVSYATLRNDQELFEAITWDVMLLDEAQTIKNPESATFQTVRAIPAAFRMSLTGTPIENTIMDLWSHMDAINPGMLGSLKRFRSRFGYAIEERQDGDALATLSRMVHPFLLRRRKEDVARDLPPREDIILPCELGPAQRTVYQDVRDSYRLKVEDSLKKNGIERSATMILEALLRMRQACLDPAIINPAWENIGSTKLDTAMELIRDLAAEGHKVLVFSQFVELLKRLRTLLNEAALSYAWLDGSSTDRPQQIARFQSDVACPVFLLSLKAGGVGINLTAADYVILLDPWWNPAVESQAIDRAHRIGQDKPVFVYRLIAIDTVEEKIQQMQARKRMLADSMTQNGLPAHFDMQELMELFG